MYGKTTQLFLTAIAILLMVGSAHAQTIVYQDNFDGDGLDVNAGIGGGLDAYDRQGAPWLDNGDLDFNRTGNNDRGNVSSMNTFDLTAGFKLEVTHTINNVTTIDANRAVIGLLDADDLPENQTNTTYITDFLNRDLDKYGIGLNLTIQNGTQGLNFADGAALNQLSNAQTITTGTQSWVLEVDADGNWSYSIDGAPATTGTSAFDLARDYHFFVYAQDNHHHLKVHSVTLSTSGGSPDLPGDTDGNGFVDDDDLAVLLSNWEQDPGTITDWSLGDFTGDTDVDDDDLAVLLGNWTGAPPAGAAVPEPATMMLLALGGLAVLRRRK